MKGKALFVRRPRTINDVMDTSPIACERQYETVKTITLRKIDYENFITDMLADRRFIEENCGLCSEGETMKCLLVSMRGRRDGVLIVPENRCYVGYAAYKSACDS